MRARSLLLLGGSLLLSMACWFDHPAFLRGISRHQGGWLWRFYPDPRRPLAVAVTLVLFALLALLLQKAAARTRSWFWPTLGLCAGAFALELAVVGLTRSERGAPWVLLAAHELSPTATGHFQAVARWPDIRILFRDWPMLRPDLPPPHLPYQPPFAVLPAWLSLHLFEARPGLAHWLTRVTHTQRVAQSSVEAAAGLWTALASLAACALAPLFAVPLLRARGEPAPIAVAALAAALPALLIHTPTLYQQQVPLFLLGCLLAQCVQLPLGGLLAGVVVGVAAELSFVSLALWNVVAVVVGIRARSGARVLTSIAAVAAGTIVVFLAVQAVTGFSWAEALLTILSDVSPEEKLNRPYLPSLWRNVVDVAVWCGPLPLAGLVAGALQAIGDLLRGRNVDGLPLALMIGLGVLDASGAIRAEAGRVWLAYFPVVLIAAVPTLGRLLPGRWLWLAGCLQLAHTWVLLSRWGS